MLVPLKVKEPFHHIEINIKGFLPILSKGNHYIIITMDYFTKWPEAKAISDIKADIVAQFIYEEIICCYSVPKKILSDKETFFVNQVIKKLCINYQTKYRLILPYQPQTNEMV